MKRLDWIGIGTLRENDYMCTYIHKIIAEFVRFDRGNVFENNCCRRLFICCKSFVRCRLPLDDLNEFLLNSLVANFRIIISNLNTSILKLKKIKKNRRTWFFTCHKNYIKTLNIEKQIIYIIFYQKNRLYLYYFLCQIWPKNGQYSKKMNVHISYFHNCRETLYAALQHVNKFGLLRFYMGEECIEFAPWVYGLNTGTDPIDFT